MGLFERDYYIRDTRMPGTFASRVYGWMTAGLGITTLVALGLYFSGLYKVLFPMWAVWCFATLGVSFLINSRIHKMTVSGVIGAFITYAVLEGLFFGTIMPVYAAAYGGGVIWASFGTAALIFGGAAAYGMFTKHDLTQLSRLLYLGVMGFVFVTLGFVILSLFIHMPMAYLFICYLGLAIFVGLTVTDAQAIRRVSERVHDDSDLAYKLSMVMALKMYCNVIMVFWYVLQIFSSSGNRD
ncbi:Bax inhibitor-1/YccA family protein [Chlamydiifrater volucris]|uniref:Bax inhibitor-1/YccA family protein n=1 Tax=Chlamydiifrater volucris TaxID=2681470 RepID=UPI001BD0D617|nr:Bax inhibitor-1/YccA family protein [Chlamydiifrater volucris]